ncbi:MAG: GAF domain-containing SpoIIE family protein phosphatase [Streptosporangiaceae bacterium]
MGVPRQVMIISDAHTAELPARVYDPERLLAVARTGLMDTGPDAGLDDLAVLAASVTGARRAFVTLVDSHRSFWKSVVAVPEGGPAGALAEPVDLAVPVRQNAATDSPCQVMVGTDRELIAPDAARDKRINDLAAVRELGIGAWAGFPIRSRSGQVLGGLCVVDDEPRAWTDVQMRGLATLARAVSTAIGAKEDLDRAHLQISELALTAERSAQVARTLQESLLPPVLTCPPWLDAAAVYLPATGEDGDVIGDFFDLFHTRNTWWCAVVGDVCGHGLEAAKVTALARYTVRAEATQHTYPAKVLHRLNQAVVLQKVSERFLTAVCVAIRPVDPAGLAALGVKGMISLGGHPAGLLRRADGTVTMIGRQGLLLGILDDVEPATDGFDLAPGDLLLLYTDGATEIRDPAGELLHEEGLARLLSGVDATTAEQVLAELMAALAAYTGDAGRFQADDDTALLVLRAPTDRD